jgi:hypothetical protein
MEVRADEKIISIRISFSRSRGCIVPGELNFKGFVN